MPVLAVAAVAHPCDCLKLSLLQSLLPCICRRASLLLAHPEVPASSSRCGSLKCTWSIVSSRLRAALALGHASLDVFIGCGTRIPLSFCHNELPNYVLGEPADLWPTCAHSNLRHAGQLLHTSQRFRYYK